MTEHSLKENEIVELKIQEISRDGRGIGRMNGQVIFVKGGKLGETIRVRITKRGVRAAEAEAVDYQGKRLQPITELECAIGWSKEVAPNRSRL